MQTGEVGIEITPIIDAPSLESRFAAQLDAKTGELVEAISEPSEGERR